MSSHKRVFKNALFLYGLTFSNYFIGLLMFPYLSRVLSVEQFGVVGFATSFCLIFQMIVEYGFQISTTATVSLHREDLPMLSRVISTMTYAKTILLVMTIIAFAICGLQMASVRSHISFIFLFFIDSLIKAFLPDAYFRGVERMKDITIRTVVAKSGILVMTILFVKDDNTAYIYPLSMIIFDMIALVWAFVLLKKDGLTPTGTTRKELSTALKESFWFFISRVSVSINGSLGSIFLGQQYAPNSVEMGLYSASTRLSTAGEQMIPPIGDALYPSMMKHKDYRFFYRVVVIGGIVWFIVCGLVSAFAPQLCGIVLGEQYVEAGNYLRILMVGVFFGYFSFMFGYPALSPMGKATYANIAIMISAATNLCLCGLLWICNSISLLSICLVFASSNIVVFIVRFISFVVFTYQAKFRH